MAPSFSSSSTARATCSCVTSRRSRRSKISRTVSKRLPRVRRSSMIAVWRSFRSVTILSRGAAGAAVLRSRRAHALGGDAPPRGTDGLGESVEHGLRAQLVVKSVAVHAERLGRLRDVAAAGGHGRDNVLALERLDGLLECDAVTDQLTNDLIQTIINTDHRNFAPDRTLRRARFYTSHRSTSPRNFV